MLWACLFKTAGWSATFEMIIQKYITIPERFVPVIIHWLFGVKKDIVSYSPSSNITISFSVDMLTLYTQKGKARYTHWNFLNINLIHMIKHIIDIAITSIVPQNRLIKHIVTRTESKEKYKNGEKSL